MYLYNNVTSVCIFIGGLEQCYKRSEPSTGLVYEGNIMIDV